MNTSPRPDATQIRTLLQTELSSRHRLGYVFLLLFDLAMAAVIGSLWATETALPLRTQIAFAAMLVISLSWAVLFGSTLLRRRVFLAAHRLHASRLAVAFTGTFTAGMLLLAMMDAELRTTGLSAAALGALMLIVATVMLVRASRRVNELVEQRRRLELASSIGLR